jgi:hypothetical protein
MKWYWSFISICEIEWNWYKVWNTFILKGFCCEAFWTMIRFVIFCLVCRHCVAWCSLSFWSSFTLWGGQWTSASMQAGPVMSPRHGRSVNLMTAKVCVCHCCHIEVYDFFVLFLFSFTHFLPSKLRTTCSYAQVKLEKNEWCHKKKNHKK